MIVIKMYNFVNSFSPNEEEEIEMELLNENVDGWEIAANRVSLQVSIGHGAFGVVWRALLYRSEEKGGNRTVAAKCFTRKFIKFTKHLIPSANAVETNASHRLSPLDRGENVL